MRKQSHFKYCFECTRYDYCNNQAVIEIHDLPACTDFKGVDNMLFSELRKVISPEQIINVYSLKGEIYDGLSVDCNIDDYIVKELWFSKINNRLMIEVE